MSDTRPAARALADSVVQDGELAAPPARVRVADRVFEELLGAILRGELAPGEAVPTQRALSREFGVSPLVVRHAIHRLEELELVRVRQGSSTIVLDPNQAADVRLMQLQLEAAKPGDALALAGLENRALSALPLVVLAARRITEKELDELDRIVDALGPSPARTELEAFQAVYWGQVADATRNPLLSHQVRWWFHTLRGLGASSSLHSDPMTHEVYRDLNASLRSRQGMMETCLEMLRQLFDWTEAQPLHALNQPQPPVAPRRRPKGRRRFAPARSRPRRRK